MPPTLVAPPPPPARATYVLVAVACFGLALAIYATLTEPFTLPLAGRVLGPASLIMICVAQFSRGRRQQVVIGAGLIFGIAGLALTLAGQHP